MDKLFPVLIMCEMVIAGLIYAAAGKTGQAIYWGSGAVLNFAVIFLMTNK